MVWFALPLTVVLIVLCEYGGGRVAKGVNLALLRKRARGKLVLTYDDGPGSRLEDRLIAVLKERNARATFFLNAKRSLEYPQRSAVLKSAGHEVACHTFEHLDAWHTFPWRAMRDTNQAYQVLDDWLTTRFTYRPPSGRLTTSTWLLLTIRGIRVALWTHDSGDTLPRLPEPSSIVADVSRAGGGVVLMHSFDRRGKDFEQRERYIVELTDRLLDLARQEHLHVCSFSELLDR
ncbi:MAG: polysaccharide deacetylase family protein [Sedimentisphaerales bacterium]|nr:polysaccharide deacetylase family protein [Sedimentisphaerales bacterium]